VTQVLAIAPNFPSPKESQDGQANYLTRVVPTLAKAGGLHVHIIALRIGSQPHTEEGNGWSVQRVDPPIPLPDIFGLYLPEHLRPALATLHDAAIQAATELGPDIPVWAHGYETGTIVETLVKQGHHVVAVPHYLVGVETLHDLALGDDATRKHAFDSPWATAIGQITPRALRPMGVRWASRTGSVARHAPLPKAIRTQFAKLDLERRMVANATAIVAVGPSFEAEMNDLYPCTIPRSRHVIAGRPATIPEAAWPWAHDDEALKIIMVGRPTGQKGWDYGVEALHALGEAELSRIELAIIGGLGQGSGPYSAYSERVAVRFDDLPHAKVANLGALAHEDVMAHLAGADLLLFPSVFEPLGLVLIEAMAAGCCVLASDASGPSDVLLPPWGHLVGFVDPQVRVEAITEGLRLFLATSRTELDRLAELARVASAAHSWERCATAHLQALTSHRSQIVDQPE
jgi:glycosyltransferase involved in cell wall biosynthesis